MLELAEVWALYGRVPALHGVSLEVRQGEIVAFLDAYAAFVAPPIRCGISSQVVDNFDDDSKDRFQFKWQPISGGDLQEPECRVGILVGRVNLNGVQVKPHMRFQQARRDLRRDGEILYIDDRQENIDAGAARGWRVILQETPEKTVHEITELGLLILHPARSIPQSSVRPSTRRSSL